MSKFDKLTIQGVRSFSPDKTQAIKFDTLTLILGRNGAGKTTIIESLRYVCTGEYPPNSGNGQTFGNDPNASGKLATNAVIKLQFKPVSSPSDEEPFIISRPFKITVDKKKQGGLSMSRLSPTLKQAAAGSRSAITKNIDIEMIELLGVPKAILSNVMLCHQEESNWPLSEGKKLKEKFDDIFGSKGYVTGLEKIRTEQKKANAKKKVCETNVGHLKITDQQAKDFKRELAGAEQNLTQIEKEIHELDNQISPITRDRKELEREEAQYDLMSQKLEQLRAQISERKKTIESITNSMSKPFDGTLEELEEEIANFKSEVKTLERQRDEIEGKLVRVDKNIKKMAAEKESITVKIKPLGVERSLHEKELSERSKMISKLIKSPDRWIDLFGRQASLDSFLIFCGIDTDSGDELTIDSDQARKVEKYLSKKVKEFQDNIKSLEQDGAEKSTALDKDLQELVSKESSLSAKLDVKESTYRKRKSEYNDLNELLERMASNDTKTSSLTTKKKKLQQELNDLKDSDELGKLATEMGSLKEQKAELEREIADKRELQDQLNAETSIASKKASFEGLKREKERKISSIMDKNPAQVRSLGVGKDGDFTGKLQEKINQVDEQLKDPAFKELEDRQITISAQLKSLSAEKESKKQEIATLKKEIKKAINVYDPNKFDKELAQAQEEYDRANDELSAQRGHKAVIRKLVTQMESDKKCPLCSNEFKCSADVTQVKDNLNETMLSEKESDSQEEIRENLMRDKARAEKYLKSLQEVKPHFKRILELESNQTTIAQQLDKLSEEKQENQEKLTEESEKRDELQDELSTLRSLVSDAAQYDECLREVAEYGKKISDLTKQLSSDLKNVSPDKLRGQIKDLQAKLTQLNKSIESANNMINKLNARTQDIGTEINDIERALLALQKDKQEEGANIKRKTELESELLTLKSSIKSLTSEVEELAPKIQAVKDKNDTLKRDCAKKTDEIKIKMSEIEKTHGKFSELNERIKDYLSGGNPEQLAELESQLKSLDTDLKAEYDKMESMDRDRAAVVDKINSQDVTLRSFNDAKRIFELKDQIKESEAEIHDKFKGLATKRKEDFISRRRYIDSQLNELNTQVAEKRGAASQIGQTISMIKGNLKKEIYATAHEKLVMARFQLIKFKTAAEDLNKYYTAFDWALTQLHIRKLNHLNATIKYLWQVAYKGHDIAEIAIRADEEKRTADATKRNYNYRVVMIDRNRLEMDMRGRCSAGQKVLASIVIRLALAEIFCIQCGVLALDEPTTNLDEANIESLAQAIVDLTAERRRKQENFQLIIITHDTGFLKHIADNEHMSLSKYFWLVKKDKDGCSKITRKEMEDLESAAIQDGDVNGDGGGPGDDGDSGSSQMSVLSVTNGRTRGTKRGFL